MADAGLMDAAPLAGENNHIGGLAEVAQDRIFKDVFLYPWLKDENMSWEA